MSSGSHGSEKDTSLTKKEITEFRKAFDTFETFEGSNVILTNTLGTVLRSLGQNPTNKKIQDMSNALDQNGNGRISFDVFLKAMEEEAKETRFEQELQDAFRVFDKDGNGVVSLNEIRTVLSVAVEEISEKTLNEMVQDMDLNNDGVVDYQEFVSMMLR